jgi:hypothetical protein
MSRFFIVAVFFVVGIGTCKAADNISKADIVRTVQHMQALAKEQKAQLAAAQKDLLEVQKRCSSLEERNAVLEEKAHRALRKFLALYAVIALLLAWTLRGPILGAAKLLAI